MASPADPGCGRTVLLLHPQTGFLLAARLAFRGAGFRVVPVVSEEEAFDYLRAGGPADLMVVGVPLAGRLPPLHALQAIRPGLKVLAVVGERSTNRAQLALLVREASKFSPC